MLVQVFQDMPVLMLAAHVLALVLGPTIDRALVRLGLPD